MGYICHHAIVVTGAYRVDPSEGPGEEELHWAELAQRKAREVFEGVAEVTEVTADGMNNVRSFLIAPDGSKEGWDLSDKGNGARRRYIEWLEEQVYGDGSSPLAWALIQYADDNHNNRMVRDSEDAQVYIRAWDRAGR